MYNISLDCFIFSFLWHDYHHSRMRSGDAIAWILPQTGCFSTTSLSMMVQTNMSCQRRTLGMSWMIWDSNLHHDLKRYLLLVFFFQAVIYCLQMRQMIVHCRFFHPVPFVRKRSTCLPTRTAAFFLKMRFMLTT